MDIIEFRSDTDIIEFGSDQIWIGSNKNKMDIDILNTPSMYVDTHIEHIHQVLDEYSKKVKQR
jgi:hypothetical protein